jgi:hypothetical protein
LDDEDEFSIGFLQVELLLFGVEIAAVPIVVRSPVAGA